MTLSTLPPSGYEIYVIMQKRGDGQVYPDMHKTSGKFFYSPKDAQVELDTYPSWLKDHMHIVPIVAVVAADWNEFFEER